MKLLDAVISELPFRRIGASKEFWIVVRGSFFYFESQCPADGSIPRAVSPVIFGPSDFYAEYEVRKSDTKRKG